MVCNSRATGAFTWRRPSGLLCPDSSGHSSGGVSGYGIKRTRVRQRKNAPTKRGMTGRKARATSKGEFGADDLVVERVLQLEAEFFADAHDVAVVGENVGGELGELFVAADNQKTGEEFFADSVPLPLVADDDGDFRLLRSVDLHHAAHA